MVRSESRVTAIAALLLVLHISVHTVGQEVKSPTPKLSELDSSKPASAESLLRLLRLLREKSVLDDLNCTEEQRKELPAFRLSIYKQNVSGSVPFADQEARNLAIFECNRLIDKSLSSFLSPTQHRRLKQIDLQARAANGWGLVTVISTSEISKELEISESQKGILAEIRNSIQAEYPKLIQGGRQESLIKMDAFRKANNRKVEQMFTEAQKSKWKEMIGSEFKSSINLQEP